MIAQDHWSGSSIEKVTLNRHVDDAEKLALGILEVVRSIFYFWY